MFRIGIIGSDSHADAFSKLINLKTLKPVSSSPDCKVTGIFGLEKERTEEVAKRGTVCRVRRRACRQG